MNLSNLKGWLIPISTSITLITAAIGGYSALGEFKVKLAAETRLMRSAELESDIKLLKLFTEIMPLANARGESTVSEKAIEKLLSPEIIKELGLSIKDLETLLDNAVITAPVGLATQDAAIAVIWVLGKKHEILTPVSIQALKSLSGFKKIVADPYLEDLELTYKSKFNITPDD